MPKGRGRHRRLGPGRYPGAKGAVSGDRQLEGDGAVPLKFVRERFPADVKNIEVGAAPSNWPRRGVIAFAGADAPCHVSFLAPDVNVEMQNFLGPLLPVARFLKIPVLDFDRYGLLFDAERTAEACVPAATSFLRRVRH